MASSLLATQFTCTGAWTQVAAFSFAALCGFIDCSTLLGVMELISAYVRAQFVFVVRK
jgi:hypothetical protein